MQGWFACSPCHLCNEESKLICYCSRINLCNLCLDKHLIYEPDIKHSPISINESLTNDELESKKRAVLNAIKSRLQNEVLQLEEFKRISLQTVHDFINVIQTDIEEFRKSVTTSIEKQCNIADEALRCAISLSKLSLNVYNPIISLFKACRTPEDVKEIQITERKFEFLKPNSTEILMKSLEFRLKLNQDKNIRAMPSRSPAEAVLNHNL